MEDNKDTKKWCVREPEIETEWKEEDRCVGCGHQGVVHMNISNGGCGTGTSLCIRCLYLIHIELVKFKNRNI